MMDELAKAVQKKYIEDITKKYPLHRFLIVFILLLSAHVYSKNDGSRILAAIQDIKLSFVFDFKKGLISSVTFEHLFICILTTWVIAFIYNLYSSKTFNLLSKASDFSGFISKIEDKVKSQKSEQEMLNYFLSKDISKQLEELRAKIKSDHVKSELALAIIFCLMYGVNNFIYWDWLFVTGLLIFILANTWNSFRYYISDFLPYYVTEQSLLGGSVSFGDK